MQNRSDIASDTAGLPSDYAGLVERLRREGRWVKATRGDLTSLMEEAAEAIAALSRATEATGEFFIQERGDDMLICEKGWQFNRCIARRPALLSNDEWRPTAQRIAAALAAPPAPQPALSEQGEAAQPAAEGPVPAYECPFSVGQPVKIAAPYAEEDPDKVFFVTGINWEHRRVAAKGWNITIASAHELQKGYGATDGFSPSDLSPASPGIASQAEPKHADDCPWDKTRLTLQRRCTCGIASQAEEGSDSDG